MSQPPGATWRLGRRPALDGVRGLAFAMVLAGHAGWPLAGTRAHELGVELFFVLSGFLITCLLLEEHDREGGVALGRFYGRRARRLLPALVALVVAVLAVASVSARLDWDASRRGAIGGLTYSTNILRVHGWSQGSFGHLWSLAVEEHFYIVWPAVLLAALVVARRTARPGLVLAVPIVLALACFAWRVWLVARGGGDLNTRLYYPTDTRVLGPLAGCALAVVKVRYPVETSRSGTRVGVAGAAGLAVLAWLAAGPAVADRPAMFVVGLPLATLAGVAICAACAGEPNRVSALFELRPLRWLGQVSYGGYLVHYPIYFFFGYELTAMSTREAITVIALSLVGAAVMERLVERPFRRGPTRPADDAPAPKVAVPA